MRSLLLVLSLLSTSLLASDATVAGPTADEVLARLMEGNRRFAEGKLVHPHQTVDRRAQVAQGQKPVATVLTCSDSRVSPELYFDQGLGDLFVIRNAGNILDDHVLGSIEYAVEHLGSPLIIIVGHEKCGAVAATVAGGHAPGHIHSIVESIQPAVAASSNEAGDKVENAVRANARHMAASLAKSEPLIDAATRTGKVKIIAARYDLGTGRIEILR